MFPVSNRMDSQNSSLSANPQVIDDRQTVPNLVVPIVHLPKFHHGKDNQTNPSNDDPNAS